MTYVKCTSNPCAVTNEGASAYPFGMTRVRGKAILAVFEELKLFWKCFNVYVKGFCTAQKLSSVNRIAEHGAP